MKIVMFNHHQDVLYYVWRALRDMGHDVFVASEKLCFEYSQYSTIGNNECSGVLLLDDIHLNEPMQKFWDSLTQEKHDLTEFGHFTGTGMVLFGGSEND